MAFVWNRALPKNIGYAAAGLVGIAAGVVFVNFVKETPTGESALRNIICWGSGSGSQVCIRETGAIVASGSITVQGVKLGTGTSLTQLTADGLYINEGGDTATGAYVFSDSVEVGGTLSGSTLVSESLLSCANLQTNATGALACNATDYLEEAELDTFSEIQTQIADKTLVNEEDAAIFDGDIGVRGTLSGAVIRANNGNIYVERRYATFVLFGSGISTATGANILGNYEIPVSGTIVGAYANVGEAADNALTTIDVFIGGTSAFTTPITIDATELTSRTALAAVSIDTSNDDFAAGDYITFSVNTPAATPAKALNVTLVLDLISTP